MEITHTIVTHSAIHETETEVYHAEYNVVNGLLERIQCNITARAQENDPVDHLGSVYMENGQVSGNIPYGEHTSRYFDTVMKLIANIIESIPAKENEEQTETPEQKSR